MWVDDGGGAVGELVRCEVVCVDGVGGEGAVEGVALLVESGGFEGGRGAGE